MISLKESGQQDVIGRVLWTVEGFALTGEGAECFPDVFWKMCSAHAFKTCNWTRVKESTEARHLENIFLHLINILNFGMSFSRVLWSSFSGLHCCKSWSNKCYYLSLVFLTFINTCTMKSALASFSQNHILYVFRIISENFVT